MSFVSRVRALHPTTPAKGVLSVTIYLMVASLIIRLTLPLRVFFMVGQPLELLPEKTGTPDSSSVAQDSSRQKKQKHVPSRFGDAIIGKTELGNARVSARLFQAAVIKWGVLKGRLEKGAIPPEVPGES